MEKLNESQRMRLEQVYYDLGVAYDEVAQKLTFSCQGCTDNCCDSYFQHHTYLEWIYLLEGFSALPQERQEEIMARCIDYEAECAKALARDERPQVMCPLCEDGLCTLYQHRMLVCRTHGVPAIMRFPTGQVRHFMGCFRCQEIVEQQYSANDTPPHVERNPHLAKLIELENEVCQGSRAMLPKVKKTIAQMIIEGVPKI